MKVILILCFLHSVFAEGKVYGNDFRESGSWFHKMSEYRELEDIPADSSQVLWSSHLSIIGLETKDMASTEPIRVPYQSIFTPSPQPNKKTSVKVRRRRIRRKRKSKIFPSISLFGTSDSKKRKLPETELNVPEKRAKIIIHSPKILNAPSPAIPKAKEESFEDLSSAEPILKKIKTKTESTEDETPVKSNGFNDDGPRKVRIGRRKKTSVVGEDLTSGKSPIVKSIIQKRRSKRWPRRRSLTLHNIR